MRKIVLVIGEVTRNDYQPLRFKLLNQGHTPVIVRGNASSFVIDLEKREYELYDRHDLSDKEVERHASQILEDMFENFSNGCAFVIIDQSSSDVLAKRGLYDKLCGSTEGLYLLRSDQGPHWLDKMSSSGPELTRELV